MPRQQGEAKERQLQAGINVLRAAPRAGKLAISIADATEQVGISRAAAYKQWPQTETQDSAELYRDALAVKVYEEISLATIKNIAEIETIVIPAVLEYKEPKDQPEYMFRLVARHDMHNRLGIDSFRKPTTAEKPAEVAIKQVVKSMGLQDTSIGQHVRAVDNRVVQAYVQMHAAMLAALGSELRPSLELTDMSTAIMNFSDSTAQQHLLELNTQVGGEGFSAHQDFPGYVAGYRGIIEGFTQPVAG